MRINVPLSVKSITLEKINIVFVGLGVISHTS